MTITIWGRYKSKQPEVVDRATSKKDAAYLLGEYMLAFGPGWKLWAGRKDQEPCC